MRNSACKVWELRSGRCEATLSGHTEGVNALTALPDGRLTSGSGDSTIKVWDLRSGRCKATLSGHRWTVTALTALPDGRLASGSKDDTIKVWDVSPGWKLRRCEATLSGHAWSVLALTALPDGRLASGSYDFDKTIKVWELRSGRCEATLSGHGNSVNALTALPDGRLASGSSDNTIKVWDVRSGRCEATLSGHTSYVSALTVLPDGRLASGSWDNTIKVWPIPALVKTLTVDVTFQGELRGVYLSLTQLADGVVLILSQPAKEALTQCVAALKVLYPEVTFKETITDQQLQLTGLSQAIRDEVIKLLRLFVTTPAPVAGHRATLLGKPSAVSPTEVAVAAANPPVKEVIAAPGQK